MSALERKMAIAEMSQITRSDETELGLRDDAYERLLMAIIFGDLAPGLMVDEKTLAQQVGVGLASARDALQRLALEGLVERLPRIGTRIPDLSLRDMQNVFEARMLLEGNCAALAAQRASTTDILDMRAALDDINTVIHKKKFRVLVQRDLAFHRALAHATGNRMIERHSATLLNMGARFWYFALPRAEPGVLEADMLAHAQVIDAIADGDAAAAEAAMRAVLNRFPNTLSKFLLGS